MEDMKPEIKQELQTMAPDEPIIYEGNNIMLDLRTMRMISAMAKKYASSDLVPVNYKGKENDCFIACEMACRMNVPPMMVMQSLYVVKGKPSWSGQACIAFVNNSGRFDKPLRLVETGKRADDTWGYRAEAEKDGEVFKGTEVTIAMARAEGWIQNTKWKNMPELMLKYRCASFFAREHCPEILMGCAVEGEAQDSESKAKTTVAVEVE